MRKILLVENNEDNRDMLARRLTYLQGFEVCSAVDGPAGVALASTESPDLILMDIALGPTDGWEATLLIKAAPATASIPVIAVTAHALSSDSRQEHRDRLRGFRYQTRRPAAIARQDQGCLEAWRRPPERRRPANPHDGKSLVAGEGLEFPTRGL